MQSQDVRGTMQVSENGWIRCPGCGFRFLKQIQPDEDCERLALYCRKCKRRYYVSIRDGQCVERPSLR